MYETNSQESVLTPVHGIFPVALHRFIRAPPQRSHDNSREPASGQDGLIRTVNEHGIAKLTRVSRTLPRCPGTAGMSPDGCEKTTVTLLQKRTEKQYTFTAGPSQG